MDENRIHLNTTIHIRDGFEKKETMSQLERARIQIISSYRETYKEINSPIAAGLSGTEIKMTGRLISKAEKLDVIKGDGEINDKVYFR